MNDLAKSALLTNEIDNAVGNTQSTCGLHTATQLNDLRLKLASRRHTLQFRKVLPRQVDKARAYALAHQILRDRILSLLGNLGLQLARPKAQVHHHLAAGRNGVGLAVGCTDASVMFLDLVPACDSEVDLALANEGGDIGGGEEDESDGEVLDEGNVEAVLAAELNVGTLEEVQGGGIEPTLCLVSACGHG